MSAPDNEFDAFVKQMVNSIENGNAAFFVGAGVSMIEPSNLPSGKKLKEIVLETLLTSKFKREIGLLHKNKMYNEIIPEVLFSEIQFIIQRNIFPIFNVLDLALPNEVHGVLAKVYLAYNTPIYTTNFDLLIDSFLPENSVFHLHGDLNNINDIYIVLNKILKGISFSKWSDSAKSLQNKDLYVLGYSGNDKDILDFIDKSSVSKIIWLVRSGDNVVFNNVKDIFNKEISIYEGDLNKLPGLIFEKIKSLEKVNVVSKKTLPKNVTNRRNEIITDYRSRVSEYQISLVLMRVYHRIGMYKRSVEIGKSLLKDRNVGIHDYYRASVLTSDLIRLSPGGYNEALKLMNNIIKRGKSKETIAYAEVLNSKAVILLHKVNFDKPSRARSVLKILNSAIYYLERDKNALERDVVFNRERYRIMKSFIYQNMGLSYYLLAEFDSAKKFMLKSLYLKRKLSHLNGMISSYKSLSILNYAMKNRRYYYYWREMAFDLINKYSLVKLKIEFFRELGELMIYLGEIENGKETLMMALSLAESELSDSRHKVEIEAIIKKIVASH